MNTFHDRSNFTLIIHAPLSHARLSGCHEYNEDPRYDEKNVQANFYKERILIELSILYLKEGMQENTAIFKEFFEDRIFY